MMIKYVAEILDECGFLWDIGYEIREGMLDRDYPFELGFSSRRFRREIRAGLYFYSIDDKDSNFRSVSLTNTRGLFGRFVGEGFSSLDLAVFSKLYSTRDDAKNGLASFQSRFNVLKAHYADEMLGKRWFSSEFLSAIPRYNFPSMFWIGKKDWFYEGHPVQLTIEQVQKIRAACQITPPQSELTPEVFEKHRRKLTPGINDYKTARLLYESVFDSFGFLRILNWSGYIVGRMWAQEDALHLRFQSPKKKVLIDFRWEGKLKFRIRQSTGFPFVRRVCRFSKLLHQGSQFKSDSMSSISEGVALLGRVCQEHLAEELKKERVKSI